ncbi:hypothetical protein [Steroidobacter cummioxidans]|uniref:hypothetical protein n=1 Tax=Steroidobacter cummioxidans TaxID=1803913 RepID=UPI000E318E28|nr:hypothetical protein [Steroidobacter cummioxidans]
MSGPTWLALIAVVWWAALLNPAQAGSFATGIFDATDLPATVASANRHLSLQTNDRRRAETMRDGSVPIALTPKLIAEVSFEPVPWLGITTHRPIARPTHSPAQPRAPPANT